MHLKTLLFCMLAAFTVAPVIVYGQQPSYRIRQLTYEQTYEGQRKDFRQQDYVYYSNRGSALLGWNDMPRMFRNPDRAISSMNYDLAELYYDSNQLGKMKIYLSLHQTFDNNGKLYTHGTYEPVAKTLETDTLWYDAQGRLTAMYDDSSWSKNYREEYYYDAQGRPEKMERRYLDWNNQLDNHWHYTYNGTSGKPASYHYAQEIYSMVHYANAEKYYYIYDGAERLVEEFLLKEDVAYSMDTVEHAYYTYNSAGYLQKEDRYLRDRGSKQYYDSVTFLYSYDGNNRLQSKLNIKMNGTGKASDSINRVDYGYDAFNLPATMAMSKWEQKIIPQQSIWDTVYKIRTVETYRATYELYWPTSVQDNYTEQVMAELYPVPATTALNIKTRITRASECKGSITDMSGKLLSSFIMPAKEQTASIPLQGIPPGTYILRLEGATEIINRKFVVQ